jgi:hypothetical protein
VKKCLKLEKSSGLCGYQEFCQDNLNQQFAQQYKPAQLPGRLAKQLEHPAASCQYIAYLYMARLKTYLPR